MPLPPRNHIVLLFRALADPVRLRLLSALGDGELCVCDLMAIVVLPQATVSRHLSYLRRAGLVDVRHDASWNYYALSTSPSPVQTRLLECVRLCAVDMPEVKADAKRARRIRQRGGCC